MLIIAMGTTIPRKVAFERSLVSLHPEVGAQWHPLKNTQASSDAVSAGSDYIAWWVCDKGHEYQCAVKKRTGSRHGCSYCSGNKVLAGFNDLATTHPHLAEQWSTVKNSKDAEEVTHGSGYKAHWVGQCGHEWVAAVYTRTSGNGAGCPTCAGKKHYSSAETTAKDVVHAETVAVKYPDLAAQWSLRNVVQADECYSGTQVVWWTCLQGHEWQSSISARVRGSGCVYCSNQKVLKGHNDFESQYPKLALLWHPLKNEKTPGEVVAGSSKKYWWKCLEGHTWERSVNAMPKRPDCPVCISLRGGRTTYVLGGVNDLQTLRPDVAEEWDLARNLKSPDQYSTGARDMIWWQCSHGHSYQCRIEHRVARHIGCPYCSNTRLLVGFNDLRTTHPQLCLEWDNSRNDYSPEEVISGTDRYAWWICEEGHKWRAQVNTRALRGYGCPQCSTPKIETMLRTSLTQVFDLTDEPSTKKVWFAALGKKAQVDIRGEYHGHQIIVEYDGIRWHSSEKSIEKDLKYTRAFLDEGYIVVRVREGTGSKFLPHLEMVDPALIQVSYNYSLRDEKVSALAEEIVRAVSAVVA